MRTFRLPQTDLDVSCIGYGCMNIGGEWQPGPLTEADQLKAERLITAAFDHGITLFDHADIYAYGKSETAFGTVLRKSPALRDRIVVQSKCGIRFKGDPQPSDPGRYDFSREHIIQSVEGSLRRLNTDRLDVLLLHRPDPLIEPEEVAQAFDELHHSGKVRYFGVSNHTAGQIALLRRFVQQPLVVNQVELNLIHSELISEGVVANQDGHYSAVAGTLDYCRLHDITIQAWSPLAGGLLINPDNDSSDDYARAHRAASEVTRLASDKSTSKEGLALAWLLRHPAHIQPIVGTTNLERLSACCLAPMVALSREEWFALLEAARGAAVP